MDERRLHSISIKNLIEQNSPEISHYKTTNNSKRKQEVTHIEEDNSYLGFVKQNCGEGRKFLDSPLPTLLMPVNDSDKFKSLLGKLPPANLNPNHVQFEKISLDITLNS